MRKNKFRNLSGKRFSRLLVLKFHSKIKGRIMFLCRCDCGNKKIAASGNLVKGSVKSCGCFHKESGKRNKTHGLSQTSEYHIWNTMKARCKNPKNIVFYLYGGRGIRVCRRWQNSFENFLADMGLKPTPKHTVERKNNDGNYTPSNCHWATHTEQGANKSTSVFLTMSGKTLCVTEWSRRTGLCYNSIRRNSRRFKRFLKENGIKKYKFSPVNIQIFKPSLRRVK